ncbi:MAG: hypothetical protein R3D28_03360 [Geminicoccaceae bacterium]|nr:hypothetical protein [Geminicoccaceae bacterium]
MEVFLEHERLDVDCVLFSTTGTSLADGPAFAAEALGHAASNAHWISFAAHAPKSPTAAGGIGARGRSEGGPPAGWRATRLWHVTEGGRGRHLDQTAD